MAGVRTLTSCVLLCIGLLLSGCTTNKNGVTRHFIFGFGVVTVNNAQTNLAIVQKATTLGFYGSTSPYAKVGLGYMNLQTIEVVTDSNLVIEVNKVRVTIPCVQH